MNQISDAGVYSNPMHDRMGVWRWFRPTWTGLLLVVITLVWGFTPFDRVWMIRWAGSADLSASQEEQWRVYGYEATTYGFPTVLKWSKLPRSLNHVWELKCWGLCFVLLAALSAIPLGAFVTDRASKLKPARTFFWCAIGPIALAVIMTIFNEPPPHSLAELGFTLHVLLALSTGTGVVWLLVSGIRNSLFSERGFPIVPLSPER